MYMCILNQMYPLLHYQCYAIFPKYYFNACPRPVRVSYPRDGWDAITFSAHISRKLHCVRSIFASRQRIQYIIKWSIIAAKGQPTDIFIPFFSFKLIVIYHRPLKGWSSVVVIYFAFYQCMFRCCLRLMCVQYHTGQLSSNFWERAVNSVNRMYT